MSNFETSNFLAVGGAHWDILGRATVPMSIHDDVGGRIRRMIGGVAGPVAMKLAKAGAQVELIAYAGHDELGDALLAKLSEHRVGTEHMVRGPMPTDVYLGIEAPNGLISAIADCHSLEAVSDEAIRSAMALCSPHTHLIVDGNLDEDALAHLANQTLPVGMLTLIPASPGKILRFRHFLGKNRAQLIVNLREASLLAGQEFGESATAAKALVGMGFASCIVSNGAEATSFADQDFLISAMPPKVDVKRFTGAGDTLAAHFLLAQSQSKPIEEALESALKATSEFISSEDLDA